MIKTFCFGRVSFHTLKQQKNVGFFCFVLFFNRLALSLTCNDKLRLSDDGCLQDDGMIEPDIFHSRFVARFSSHRDAGLNPRKHFHVSFTACDCLSSHHQRVMSKWCGVYTRVTLAQPLPKCLLPHLEPFLNYVQSGPDHNRFVIGGAHTCKPSV